MKLKIEFTTQFKKNYKRVKKQNKDHQPTCALKGLRDCHIEPYWILIYKLSNELLSMKKTGSHSDLFK